jgi:hypothetical protein
MVVSRSQWRASRGTFTSATAFFDGLYEPTAPLALDWYGWAGGPIHVMPVYPHGQPVLRDGESPSWFTAAEEASRNMRRIAFLSIGIPDPA